MKIGIASKSFDGWGGGIDFIRHITAAIEAADPENRLQKHLLLSSNDMLFYFKKNLQPYRSLLRMIRHKEKLRWQPWKGFDEQYLRQTFSDLHDTILEFPGSSFQSHLRFAEIQKLDVILPCIAPPMESFRLPWVGYLYDFQHKYFPEFFSKREIIRRDHAFGEMLQRASHVIVNARTVQQDADQFIGKYSAKIHVLPFSPCPQESWLNEQRDMTKPYHITKPYFIICNQFWMHKDHATTFKAFAEFLKLADKNYQLVCTGDTSDARFPDYFRKLLGLLDDLHIAENVKILGHIPKLEQIALLKKSIAVIQPTLFEGGPGGGIAHDAVSLGVPLIISDIPVNLEINMNTNERVFFFPAQDVQKLTESMQEVSQQEYTPIPNEILKAKGLARKKACGEVLLDVISQAIYRKSIS